MYSCRYMYVHTHIHIVYVPPHIYIYIFNVYIYIHVHTHHKTLQRQAAAWGSADAAEARRYSAVPRVPGPPPRRGSVPPWRLQANGPPAPTPSDAAPATRCKAKPQPRGSVTARPKADTEDDAVDAATEDWRGGVEGRAGGLGCEHARRSVHGGLNGAARTRMPLTAYACAQPRDV